MEFLAVPLPAIIAYRATRMRATSLDDARVLWDVALADSVVANLCEVAHYAWEGHLLYVPDAMLAYSSRWSSTGSPGTPSSLPA